MKYSRPESLRLCERCLTPVVNCSRNFFDECLKCRHLQLSITGEQVDDRNMARREDYCQGDCTPTCPNCTPKCDLTLQEEVESLNAHREAMEKKILEAIEKSGPRGIPHCKLAAAWGGSRRYLHVYTKSMIERKVIRRDSGRRGRYHIWNSIN